MADPSEVAARIAVVIPCHRVADRVVDVIERVPPEVVAIVCADDACPDHSGDRALWAQLGAAHLAALEDASLHLPEIGLHRSFPDVQNFAGLAGQSPVPRPVVLFAVEPSTASPIVTLGDIG